MKKLALLCVLAGCGSFQDPNVVVDLRVLGMKASVPEQVVTVDLANPPDANQVLAQLVDTDVCALISDANFDRDLRWKATLCNLDNDERCTSDVQEALGEGTWGDPEAASTPPDSFCVHVKADGNLVGIIFDTLQGDTLHGLGGIDYGVSLQVGGVGADESLDLFAAKTLRVSPKIPDDYTANHNPYLDHVEARVGEDGVFLPIATGRCVDQTDPLVVAPATKIRINPVEPPDVRETYVVPTVDGMSRTFTESITYQWTSTAGSFSDGETGGKRDVTGNPPPLFTDWKAPAAKDLDGPTDVSIWIVQRDERLGVAWYETCVRVVP